MGKELDNLREKIEARIKELEPTHNIDSNKPCECSTCYANGIQQRALFWVLSLFREHFSAEKGSKGAKA